MNPFIYIYMYKVNIYTVNIYSEFIYSEYFLILSSSLFLLSLWYFLWAEDFNFDETKVYFLLVNTFAS